jgi:hypothetical protein
MLISQRSGTVSLGTRWQRRGSIRTTTNWLQLRCNVMPTPRHTLLSASYPLPIQKKSEMSQRFPRFSRQLLQRIHILQTRLTLVISISIHPLAYREHQSIGRCFLPCCMYRAQSSPPTPNPQPQSPGTYILLSFFVFRFLFLLLFFPCHSHGFSSRF